MRRNYLYKPCVWVDSNTYTLHTVSANSEIGLGFLLIFLIFTYVLDIFARVISSSEYSNRVDMLVCRWMQAPTELASSIAVLAGPSSTVDALRTCDSFSALRTVLNLAK